MRLIKLRLPSKRRKLTSVVSVPRLVSESLQSTALELELGNLLDEFLGISLLGDQGSLGVGKGENGGTELDDFESGELGNVSGSRDSDKSGGLVEAVFGASLGNHLETGKTP